MIAARILARTAARTSVRALSEAAAPSGLSIKFVLPHKTVYENVTVDSVIVPGAAGEFGLTANHSPVLAELKPGVMKIMHNGGDVEEYFVSGGFCIGHDDSTADITCPEAVKLDELDEAAIRATFASASADLANVAEGSADAADAKIAVETTKAMAAAIGITL